MRNMAVMNDLGHRQPWPLLTQEQCTKVSLSSSCSLQRRGKRSSVKKTTAILKRATTDQNDEWKSRVVCLHENKIVATCREQWGDKSSVDTGEHVKPEGKWIEVTPDYRVLDALENEKKATWTKSGRESAKREADLYDMLEKAATDEKKEERDGDKLGDKLGSFPQKGKKKMNEATGLMEEMRKIVVNKL